MSGEIWMTFIMNHCLDPKNKIGNEELDKIQNIILLMTNVKLLDRGLHLERILPRMDLDSIYI